MSEAEEMRVTGDDQETAMREYREAGEARARALGNRGPIRFSADGSLHDDILAAYWQHGFYIFESVITQNELADIERDVQEIIERAPTEPGGVVDRHGRAALIRRQVRRRREPGRGLAHGAAGVRRRIEGVGRTAAAGSTAGSTAGSDSATFASTDVGR